MTESISETRIIQESTPQLLVSVRSAAEAVAAIAGGCQILDVKEPSRGSLGMADLAVIEQVMQIGMDSGIPVSAALGEVADYRFALAASDAERQLPPVLAGLSFTKIGLANLNVDRSWATRWQDTMSFLAASLSSGGENPEPRWVAVIYADWVAANAPPPEAIVDCVLSSSRSLGNQIAGVLVDTWSKKSGRLLDSLPVEQLRDLAQSVQQSDRFFAVAGRLTSTMLPELVDVRPDIVAVRSAACLGEDRTSSVDVGAVRNLRDRIDRTFAVRSTSTELPIGASHGPA
ncbi:MAG: hypothetical protein HQ518_32275 [Rhodopirellula sp.]|nr:hypothetical protein [Rhodopirellula sp.]